MDARKIPPLILLGVALLLFGAACVCKAFSTDAKMGTMAIIAGLLYLASILVFLIDVLYLSGCGCGREAGQIVGSDGQVCRFFPPWCGW